MSVPHLKMNTQPPTDQTTSSIEQLMDMVLKHLPRVYVCVMAVECFNGFARPSDCLSAVVIFDFECSCIYLMLGWQRV